MFMCGFVVQGLWKGAELGVPDGTLRFCLPYLVKVLFAETMAEKLQHQAGSGIDRPEPQPILEKVGDGLKATLPKAPARSGEVDEDKRARAKCRRIARRC